MKLFLLLASIALANARFLFEPINVDYHTTVGIPLATKIEQAELAQDFDGSRIIGGSQSSVGEHPHLGGLLITLTTGQRSICGSSLLSNTRLVTAAHCWRTTRHQGSSMVVVLASVNLYSGGTRVRTNNVVIHPNYNTTNLNNDVAVIVVPWVTYKSFISYITMASGNDDYVDENPLAAGFGLIADVNGNNSRLRHVRLYVMPNEFCENFYGSSVVIESTLCTRGERHRNICHGDSGGSLVLNNQLIGITSFGAERGCQLGLPGGFARVTSFNSWISAQL